MSLLDCRKPFLLSSIFSGSTSLSFTNFSRRLKVSSWKVQLQNTVSYAESSWKRVHVASYIIHQSCLLTQYLFKCFIKHCFIHFMFSASPHLHDCFLFCKSFSSLGLFGGRSRGKTWRPCSLYEVLCLYWIKWTGIPKKCLYFFYCMSRGGEIYRSQAALNISCLFWVFFHKSNKDPQKSWFCLLTVCHGAAYLYPICMIMFPLLDRLKHCETC